jgi:nucleoid-associated protein YgaU
VALGIVFGVSSDGRDVVQPTRERPVQPTRERPALGTRDPTRSSSRDSIEADVVLVVSAPGGSRANDPSAVRETLGSSATRSDSTIIHVVKKGDTLWDITERYLGDPFQYPIVAVWSRIPDPHWIEPGDIVRIIILGGRGG